MDRRRLDQELAIARSDPNRFEDQAMERISKLGERVYYGAAKGTDERTRIFVDHESMVAHVIAEALKAPVKNRPNDEVLSRDGEL
jgi:hypothetical protein